MVGHDFIDLKVYHHTIAVFLVLEENYGLLTVNLQATTLHNPATQLEFPAAITISVCMSACKHCA